MPGGIDLHCHIAGPKVNAARFLAGGRDAFARRGNLRSGVGGRVPSTFGTGYLFAGIGYTTAMDAAIPPLHARSAHEDLAETPVLDKGFYLLLGNDHAVMDHIAAGDDGALDAYVAWALGATKGYAIKVVNPGDVEDYKQISRKSPRELDEPVGHFGVTPRQIVRSLTACADRLGLPHAVHLHCNNLGMPGNSETTARTIAALEGSRCHLAHIQFHSYQGDPADPRSFASDTARLVELVKANPGLTVDVGHIVPGQAMIVTGDTAAFERIRRLVGGPWMAADLEQESSCGVIPIEYAPQNALVHAIQWAIGLEWYLLMDDPWRIALTSDHPNGGAFARYPELIAWLMDRELRREYLKALPEGIAGRTILGDLEREYSLYEIAILTRAAPARILGLADRKGCLSPGADADLTLYTPQTDKAAMFARPRWVLKAGRVVVENGEMRGDVEVLPTGRAFHVEPTWDEGRLGGIRTRFERDYSIAFRNFGAGEVAEAAEVGCSR
jgi:formylmethanofuran dehydrogenase subunit A